MQTVLIVIHLMIVLALVGLVLIQRSEGGGLGIGGGSGFMSARGTANALTRTTAILATLFFITSLSLGIMARYQAKPTDILNKIPVTTGEKGLLESLSGTKEAPKPAEDKNVIPAVGDNTDVAPATDAKPATDVAPVTETKPATDAAPATDAKPATEAVPATGQTTGDGADQTKGQTTGQ